MSDQTSGEKTEKATPKRVRDSRNKGDVAKSKDITNTVLLLLTLALFWKLGSYITERLISLTSATLSSGARAFDSELASLGHQASEIFLTISALILVPIVCVGLLMEFFQTGPILTFDKIKPKLSNLSIVSGIKRIFSLDSFFELVKSIVKTLIITGIAFITILSLLPSLINLPLSNPLMITKAMDHGLRTLFLWTVGLFSLLAVLDLSYQKYSHAKKMKMSLDDIKRESKDSEGDPQIKAQRQQISREWAREGATQSARDATVLIVNPTHIAIALEYDRETRPIPEITGRGRDEVALAMRESAELAGVPVLRNIPLARQLMSETKDGETVPTDVFDIVVEVLVWAAATKKRIHGHLEPSSLDDTNCSHFDDMDVPGEDLSFYPNGFGNTH